MLCINFDEAGTFDVIPEQVNAPQLHNELFQAMQMKAASTVFFPVGVMFGSRLAGTYFHE